MLLIIKKVVFLVGLTLYVIYANSQIVISTRNGVWTDPTTWLGGIVPTSVNATQIIIDHEVELPLSSTISVLHTVVNNKLTLKTGSVLNILTDGLPQVPDLQVTGTLVMEDGSMLNGTSVLNTIFDDGAFYVHQQGPLGFIPYATWHPNSTFQISGFKASGYINIAHSDSWKQNFGNVTYDCPEQTTSFVDLNGYLRNIAGDFNIRNTRNQSLRLSTTQNPVINIGGRFLVEGPSEVWFSTNSTAAVVNVQQDFIYRSTSTGPSYFTTRGVVALNVQGNMEVNSTGPLRMTSSAADSVGARLSTLNLYGSLNILSGTIIAPPLGNGSGKIVFTGGATQGVQASSAGNSFQGNMEYIIEPNAIVNLGSSALSGTPGSLRLRGRIQLGSTDPQGAIQLVNQGNIHIAGTRVFESGSVIEYNGTSPQWIGVGHPVSIGVNLVCNNPTEISLLQDAVVGGGFNSINGSIDCQGFTLTIYGDLMLENGSELLSGVIRLSGDQNQELSVDGGTVTNLTINKSGGSGVTLTSPLSIEGVLLIETENTALNTNGHLTLLSTSDNVTGNACVGPLPSGSSINGDVTVQRYMSGEGRIYRYISSPVENATVASMMDDFPVTGSFANPSMGPGINSTAPSFYFYDESVGELLAGWKPYPVSGPASANLLERGRGYAAFIRNGTGPTNWDVTGNLYQGEIPLPVAFTSNSEPSNGWNLVGNPYACTIDWDITGSSGWTKQNISQVIAVRDNGVGGGGIFQYWDGDENFSDIPNGQIASCQSIWVRATAPNPVLTIREGVKVTNGAEFFRSNPVNIPGFALELKRDGFTDKAYYKFRSAASPGLDDWDAVKMDNDIFDIATFSEDGIALAINAQDRMPCDTTVIQLNVKDMEAGNYTLGLVTKADFDNYTYRLIDHYLGTETLLKTGQEIEIVVTTDIKSLAADRFAIELFAIPPANNLEVSAPSFICAEEPASVVIKSAQPGVHYSVWDKDGGQLSEEKIAMAGDLKIELERDSISTGQHTLTVMARSACQQVELISHTILVKESAALISAMSSQSCMGGAVILTASADRSDLRFSWFKTPDDIDTLGTSAKWTTSVLMKPETFYVSATTSGGCTTRRYPVVADIITYDSARITWVDANTLSSNYSFDNQWYRDDELIPDGDRILKISDPGTYVLLVDTLGCISSDTVEFMITGIEVVRKDHFSLYPNPVADEFYIQTGSSGDVEIEVVNAMGELVLSDILFARVSRIKRVNVGFLVGGVYVVILTKKPVRKVIRFVKLN